MTANRQTDGQGGIVQEMLRTPVVKDILRTSLRAVGHRDGRNTIRTVMSQDPEVFLGLAVTIPAALNVLVRSLDELGRQIKAQYAPGVLAAFLESLARDIDTEAAKECKAVWKDLGSSLWESSPEARKELLDTALAKGPQICSQGINILARAVNDLERQRPGALGAFLSEVSERTDRAEWASAAQTLARPFLDRKWHLLAWMWRLVTGMVRKKMGWGARPA